MPDDQPFVSEVGAAVQTVKKLGVTRARIAKGSEVGNDNIDELLTKKDVLNEAVDTLISCLGATRTYYDIFSKTMVEEPCYATRVTAAKTLLAYRVGEPIKRTQIQVNHTNSLDDLKAKMAQNKDLAESVLEILDTAKSSEENKPQS
jgi:hypothetical protein